MRFYCSEVHFCYGLGVDRESLYAAGEAYAAYTPVAHALSLCALRLCLSASPLSLPPEVLERIKGILRASCLADAHADMEDEARTEWLETKPNGAPDEMGPRERERVMDRLHNCEKTYPNIGFLLEHYGLVLYTMASFRAPPNHPPGTLAPPLGGPSKIGLPLYASTLDLRRLNPLRTPTLNLDPLDEEYEITSQSVSAIDPSALAVSLRDETRFASAIREWALVPQHSRDRTITRRPRDGQDQVGEEELGKPFFMIIHSDVSAPDTDL